MMNHFELFDIPDSFGLVIIPQNTSQEVQHASEMENENDSQGAENVSQVPEPPVQQEPVLQTFKSFH